MKRVGIYKIGRGLVQADTNSAMTEVRYIIKALETEAIVINLNDYLDGRKVSSMLKVGQLIDTLVVIGGSMRDMELDERIKLEVLLEMYFKKIYIATDIDMINQYPDFINRFHLLLTQTTHKFDNITIPQHYSYVPELYFTKETAAAALKQFSRYKKTEIFFGGSIDGREDKLKDYFLKEITSEDFGFAKLQFLEQRDRVKLVIKGAGVDVRVPYNAFIKLQSEYIATVVMVTKQCRTNGWITARLFDSLANGTFPLVDVDYDIDEMYVDADSCLRVSNYDDLFAALLDGKKCKKECHKIMRKVLANRGKFAELILGVKEECIEGEDND